MHVKEMTSFEFVSEHGAFLYTCMHTYIRTGIDMDLIDLDIDGYSVFYGYRRPSTVLELVCMAARSTQ